MPRKITQNVAIIFHEYAVEESFEPLRLGNVEAQRDWSDSEDFVDGVWRMLNQEDYWPHIKQGGKPNDYVLSSDQTHTIKQFVEEAFNAAGFHRGECRWEGSKENTKYYHGDDLFVEVDPKFYRTAEVDLLWGNSSRARRELQWEPKTSFAGLVSKMVERDLDLIS